MQNLVVFSSVKARVVRKDTVGTCECDLYAAFRTIQDCGYRQKDQTWSSRFSGITEKQPVVVRKDSLEVSVTSVDCAVSRSQTRIGAIRR